MNGRAFVPLFLLFFVNLGCAPGAKMPAPRAKLRHAVEDWQSLYKRLQDMWSEVRVGAHSLEGCGQRDDFDDLAAALLLVPRDAPAAYAREVAKLILHLDGFGESDQALNHLAAIRSWNLFHPETLPTMQELANVLQYQASAPSTKPPASLNPQDVNYFLQTLEQNRAHRLEGSPPPSALDSIAFETECPHQKKVWNADPSSNALLFGEIYDAYMRGMYFDLKSLENDRVTMFSGESERTGDTYWRSLRWINGVTQAQNGVFYSYSGGNENTFSISARTILDGRWLQDDKGKFLASVYDALAQERNTHFVTLSFTYTSRTIRYLHYALRICLSFGNKMSSERDTTYFHEELYRWAKGDS